MLFSDSNDIRKYSIVKAIEASSSKDFFLEFGVFKARTTNLFAKYLQQKGLELHGFDSFMGLSEDWKGSDSLTKGSFSLNKKLPNVNQNVKLQIGLIDDTLEPFINSNKLTSIAFMHMDFDTYTPTEYVLRVTKQYCKRGTIILFDELYGYPGWREHEFKALNETYSDEEYDFIAFSKLQVAIRLR